MRVSFVLEVALRLLKLPVFLRIRRLQPRTAVRHSRNWRARFLPHVTRGAAAGRAAPRQVLRPQPLDEGKQYLREETGLHMEIWRGNNGNVEELRCAGGAPGGSLR